MARNFRVRSREISENSLSVKIFGDFDASSACELTNLLEESIKQSQKIAIDTDGLKEINEFGIAVFLPRMSSLRRGCAGIEVQGRFSQIFNET